MRQTYTEDQHVEPPAIGLFAKLGWPTVSAVSFHWTHNLPPLRLISGSAALASAAQIRQNAKSKR